MKSRISSKKPSLITLGMPVYNGAQTIEMTLQSICQQTFPDWTLHISDNHSTDKTPQICRQYATRDRRISYERQTKNLGAEANFCHVLLTSKSKYFAWVAADDLHTPDFLEKLVLLLENNPGNAFAFCYLAAIDGENQPVALYDCPGKFTSDKIYARVLRFVLNPEGNGKANLIYSIYRTDFVKEIYRNYPLTANWGADMNFVLACLTHSAPAIEPAYLFLKRLSHAELLRNPPATRTGRFPLEKYREYRDDALRAIGNGKLAWLAHIAFSLIALRILVERSFSAVVRLAKRFINR